MLYRQWLLWRATSSTAVHLLILVIRTGIIRRHRENVSINYVAPTIVIINASFGDSIRANLLDIIYQLTHFFYGVASNAYIATRAPRHCCRIAIAWEVDDLLLRLDTEQQTLNMALAIDHILQQGIYRSSKSNEISVVQAISGVLLTELATLMSKQACVTSE